MFSVPGTGKPVSFPGIFKPVCGWVFEVCFSKLLFVLGLASVVF
jgi:hypothetical protein